MYCVDVVAKAKALSLTERNAPNATYAGRTVVAFSSTSSTLLYHSGDKSRLTQVWTRPSPNSPPFASLTTVRLFDSRVVDLALLPDDRVLAVTRDKRILQCNLDGTGLTKHDWTISPSGAIEKGKIVDSFGTVAVFSSQPDSSTLFVASVPAKQAIRVQEFPGLNLVPETECSQFGYMIVALVRRRSESLLREQLVVIDIVAGTLLPISLDAREVTAFEVAPDGLSLFVGTKGGQIVMFDTLSGEAIGSQALGTTAIIGITHQQHGNKIAVLTGDGKVFLIQHASPFSWSALNANENLSLASAWDMMSKSGALDARRGMDRFIHKDPHLSSLKSYLAHSAFDDTAIIRAIEELASDSFVNREAASALIADYGNRALPIVIRERERTKDAEMKRRCLELESTISTHPASLRMRRVFSLVNHLSLADCDQLFRDVNDDPSALAYSPGYALWRISKYSPLHDNPLPSQK